jgi:hypothetical protein
MQRRTGHKTSLAIPVSKANSIGSRHTQILVSWLDAGTLRAWSAGWHSTRHNAGHGGTRHLHLQCCIQQRHPHRKIEADKLGKSWSWSGAWDSNQQHTYTPQSATPQSALGVEMHAGIPHQPPTLPPVRFLRSSVISSSYLSAVTHPSWCSTSLSYTPRSSNAATSCRTHKQQQQQGAHVIWCGAQQRQTVLTSSKSLFCRSERAGS